MRRIVLACAVACLVSTSTAAADTLASVPVSCTGLSVRLSDDKNYYIFTATASGDTTGITGYTFDYGDHQSYHFTFAHNQSNYRTATATHAYQQAGNYTARATANTKSGGVTSSACQASVVITPPATTLPHTGTAHTFSVFIVTAATAGSVHHIWRRRRCSAAARTLKP